VLFNSLPFLVFFVVVYGLYLATMRRLRLQNAMLLVASYFFYGWWDWRFLSLIFVSTLIDYVAGLFLDRRVGGPGAPDDTPFRLSPGARRTALAVSLTSNLGLLGFFKYYDFFASSAADALQRLGLAAHPPILDIVLPVGISFYTFQAMSYTIDVYRGVLRSEPSFTNFALFISFFPQLVAGPIVRAADLLPQIRVPRTITRRGLEEGAWLVFWGLFKKIFVADNLGRLAALGFTNPPPNGGVALVSVYAFAFQIYGDFSAYSDIARGLAKAMGFEFMLNFNLPYFATDPSDFWRRWHMSLSTWLRDYLYIPLGGNRDGTLRTYRNLLLTMLLGGLWHGAQWTFVIWGAFHGILLAAHWWWTRTLGYASEGDAPATAWLKRVVLFHLVCVGWIFFRASTAGQALQVMDSILGDFSLAGARFDSMAFYVAPLLLVQFAQWRTGDPFVIWRLHWVPRAVAYAVLWFLATLLGDYSGGEFIYFQF
jgi:D-alanyl-lipoteichoic acid acyltransferase DltB (MBOAT superfamily)